jgi:hypothetical protein
MFRAMKADSDGYHGSVHRDGNIATRTINSHG